MTAPNTEANSEVRSSSDFTARCVFLDCETVALEAQPGSVWEVAVMAADDDTPRVIQVRPDLSIAQPEALEVGRFAERYRSDEAIAPNDGLVRAWLFDNMPDRAVIVGSNPQFDIAHLAESWAADYGSDTGRDDPPWHYHPCDLPSLVAGATGRWPDAGGSLSLRWAAGTVGLDVGGYETHTAGGDVLLARDIWRAVQDMREDA